MRLKKGIIHFQFKMYFINKFYIKSKKVARLGSSKFVCVFEKIWNKKIHNNDIDNKNII